MISYELSEEQNIIRSMVRDLTAKAVRPNARHMDDVAKFDDTVLAALWSTQIIQSYAIAEFERSAVTSAIILEELGAADASLALAVAATIGYVCAIRDLGTNEQRATLEKQFQSEVYSPVAVALMEPRFGSATTGFDTKAAPIGDTFVLRGRKALVPLADRCRNFLVVADEDGQTEAFIVARDTKGVQVFEPTGALGLRAAGLAEVMFDDVQLSAAMKLGGEKGANIQRIVDGSRIAISAIMAGMSREIMAYTIPFVKDRRIDGTPLAQRQSIAFNIAEMHIDTEAMRWMTWKAAWHFDQGGLSTQQAQLAYSYAGQQTMTIADNGLQAFGGHGYVAENPLEMWYRNARALSVLEGIGGV